MSLFGYVFIVQWKMMAFAEADLADNQITMGEETRIQSGRNFKKQ